MNKNWNGAVRKAGAGVGKAGAGIGNALRRMHLWQKTGLVLCLVSWLASLGTGAYCRRTAAGLADQAFASRWSRSGESAQVSSYFAESAMLSDDNISSLYAGFMTDLQNASIALSETQIENGASLMDTCHAGMGTAEITSRGETLSVSAIGVGGDFFNFHPLDLMSGYYFSQDDLMQDRVLLDDATAWRLFGSPYVVGLPVEIGGVPHYIAGVFRRPEKRFYKEAGMGDYLIYMSFDSLCKYTEVGLNTDSNDSSDSDDSDMPEAGIPGREDRVLAAGEAGDRDCAPAAGEAGEKGHVSPSEAGKEKGEPASAAAEAAGALQKALASVTGTTVLASEKVPGTEDRVSGEAVRDAAAAVPAGSAARLLAVGETLDDTIGDGESLEDDGSGTEDEGDGGGETETGTPEEEDSEEEGDDDYTPSGPGSREDYGGSDTEEREEVNRNRISCYEVVLPEPVSGFALRLVRSRFSQAGYSNSQVSVVDNTSRYEILRLASLAVQPGVRSMQTAAIRFPYWENVALAWEDVLIPFAVLTLLLRYAPLLFLLWLVIWYMTHKSWTIVGTLRLLQDKIYDWQSEKIYGKPAAAALPDKEDEEEGRARLENGKTPDADDSPDGAAK